MPPDSRSGGPLGALMTGARGIGRGLQIVDIGIAQFERIVLSYGVLIMAVNSIANVIGRFVFGRSIYFSMELNAFLMVIITFMGLSYAARKGRHIRMSAIYDQLPDLWRKILMIVIATVTAIILFVLAYYSYSYVMRIHELGKVTPSMRVPLWITLVWVPIGFAIAGIQYVLTVFQNLRAPEVYISHEVVDSYAEDSDAVV